MVAGMARQPRLHLLVLVRAVIVEDQMQLEILGNTRFEAVEERQKFLMSMAPLALGEDLARLDVESGEEGSCTVAGVIVGDAFDIPQAQGKIGLKSLQGLDLTLLVNAEDEGVIGRIEIEPDDVTHLLDEERIGGESEAFRPVGLNAKEGEVTLHGALAYTGLL